MTPDRELNPPADTEQNCSECGQQICRANELLSFYKRNNTTGDFYEVQGCESCKPEEL